MKRHECRSAWSVRARSCSKRIIQLHRSGLDHVLRLEQPGRAMLALSAARSWNHTFTSSSDRIRSRRLSGKSSVNVSAAVITSLKMTLAPRTAQVTPAFCYRWLGNSAIHSAGITGMPEPERHSEETPRVFATTHWSVVLAAGDRSSPETEEALSRLCQSYWFPIYAFVRKRGHRPNRRRTSLRSSSLLSSKRTTSRKQPASGAGSVVFS